MWVIRAPQEVSLVDTQVVSEFKKVEYRIQSSVEQAPLVAACLVQEEDLVFLKSRALRRLVGHVAWVSGGLFHHVNQSGIHSESWPVLLKTYYQPWKGELLLRYIDRRNALCRSVNRGIYTLDKEWVSALLQKTGSQT